MKINVKTTKVVCISCVRETVKILTDGQFVEQVSSDITGMMDITRAMDIVYTVSKAFDVIGIACKWSLASYLLI